MPIEIRELEISVSLQGEGGTDEPNSTGKGRTSKIQNVDDIVARCVDQVMDLLREQNED